MSDVRRLIWLLLNQIHSWYNMLLEENLGIAYKNNDQQNLVWKQESTETKATESRSTRS